MVLEGGPNDEHIQASRGTYNLRSESGRFEHVTGSIGVRLRGRRLMLTSPNPFVFTGAAVEKNGPDHYKVYDGIVTTCDLPRPKWDFHAHKVVVEVGGTAKIYHSTFSIEGIPSSLFPICHAARPDPAPAIRLSHPQPRGFLHQRHHLSGNRCSGRSIAAWTPTSGPNTSPSEAGRRKASFVPAPAILPS